MTNLVSQDRLKESGKNKQGTQTMTFINLTPHDIYLYYVNQFVNLRETNPTIWVADSVEDNRYFHYPSMGSARINTTSQLIKNSMDFDVPIYQSQYGDLVVTGFDINTIKSNDILIVSLPVVSAAKASNHSLTSQLVSPYQVVRKADNLSITLGCTGFTY